MQTSSPPRKNPLPLCALFTANAVSLIGNVFSMVAIPWFVLQTTGSAAQTGITGFFAVMPAVLAGFLGGTLIDRLGYKRASIISDLASGVTTALIPLLYFTVGLEFWQRLKNLGKGSAYIVGPAIIFGYQGIAYVINLLLGATVVVSPRFPVLGIWLELLLVGGLWEEIGWSGYALPKLQARFANRPNGPLSAALILGVFRAIWHLPLFMYGTIYWFDIFIFALAFQIIIAWIYNRSGGSVLAVMLFHFISNIMGAVTSPIFHGNERMNNYALFMGLAALIALVIAWRSQLKLGVGQTQESKTLI